jgi:hypothetical protein
MKVYSLNARQGEPRFLQATQANYWFWQRGYDVVGFERAELDVGRLDGELLGDAENTIVCGSVAVVCDALARAGRPAPANIDFPAELKSFVGRAISEATMGEVRQWGEESPERLPVHVKPRDRHKLFAGKVVREYRDFISLSGVPADEPVLVQEVVDLVSEWRGTVLRGKVLNVAHYKGDALSFPDAKVIAGAVEAFTSAPIGYGMDWAVTADGRAMLVEINDGFALGNYGVRGHHYTALIECRWRQLMGLDDNGVGISL